MLAEMLPDDFRKYPLIVPGEYARYQSFKDSLELFRNGREVIILETGLQYKVQDLIVIDSPSHGPFNMVSGSWPKVEDYRQNASILRDYRQQILNGFGVNKNKPKRMIFLARGNKRREFNQDELWNIANGLGFERVQSEMLSFHEQVKLFHDSKCLVGASGAAWANVLFCQNGSKAITWLVPKYCQFCSYSNLAMISGTELQYIFANSDKLLANTGDAYQASYRVDLCVFQERLTKMVDAASKTLN